MGDLNVAMDAGERTPQGQGLAPAEQSATQWVSRAVSSSQRQRSQQEQQLIARGRVLMQMYQSQSGKRKSLSFSSNSSSGLRVIAGATSLPSSPSSAANGKKGEIDAKNVVVCMEQREFEALQQDNAQLSADLDQQLGYLRDAIAMQEHLETQQMRVDGIVMMLQQQRANDAKIASCVRLESADDDSARASEAHSDLVQTLARAHQDRERLELELQQSHAMIEHLEAECSRCEQTASDKQARFQRALFVKTAQLDQLCKNIPVPSAWERFVDEEEITYFRPTQYNGPPELEDPRVAIALTKLNAAPLSFSSRSTAGRITWHEKKRSASTPQPHQFHRGSAADTWCEEIEAPPDNKHHKITDFETPLPHGWEMRVTAAGYVFFVNRYTNLTTWTDPRKVVQRLQQQHAAATKMAAATKDETYPSAARIVGAAAQPQKALSISLNGSEGFSALQSDEESKTEKSEEIHRYDVVFQEPCSIGIHFQANVPDAGATVRRVLPDMAAARADKLLPYDRLVAVNKTPVDTASFRHVMLLLQGGLRPLTLTFERDPTASRKNMDSEEYASHHLDEELICDEVESLDYEGSNPQDVGGNRATSASVRERRHSSIDIEQETQQLLQVRPAPPATPEDLTVADKIITNLFSLFWTPPDPSHAPQTV